MASADWYRACHRSVRHGGDGTGPAATASGQPKTTWFFYTVKWGGQDEFLDLFQRNHYPILKAMQKSGLYLSVRPMSRRITGTAGPTGPSRSN